MFKLYAAPRSRKIRVLVVDDHLPWVEALVAMLELDARIAVVGRAFDGVEALELARELRPDLVLMDVHMPRMNGIAATRRLRAARDPATVLMVTSSPSAHDILAARSAGASGYVLKGCNPDDLVELILDAAEPADPSPPLRYRLVMSAA